jgi:polyphenol oxidase
VRPRTSRMRATSIMSMPMETITSERDALTEAGFRWLESSDGLRAITSERFERLGFTNAFSTRLGGISPFPSSDLNLAGFDQDSAENIHENRRRFFELLGGGWRLAACWQVHSANVFVVRPDQPSPEQEHCDALVTSASGILLGVKTADCVPILLADELTGACAAVHAGWRGTLAEIVKEAIDHLRQNFGARAEDLHVAIGPAARSCCYEVGRDVIDAFASKFPNSIHLFNPTRDSHALVDIQRANLDQMVECGVRLDRIQTAPLCTICRSDLFFSYRRDKPVYGRTGRLLAVIGRRADSARDPYHPE